MSDETIDHLHAKHAEAQLKYAGEQKAREEKAERDAIIAMDDLRKALKEIARLRNDPSVQGDDALSVAIRNAKRKAAESTPSDHPQPTSGRYSDQSELRGIKAVQDHTKTDKAKCADAHDHEETTLRELDRPLSGGDLTEAIIKQRDSALRELVEVRLKLTDADSDRRQLAHRCKDLDASDTMHRERVTDAEREIEQLKGELAKMKTEVEAANDEVESIRWSYRHTLEKVLAERDEAESAMALQSVTLDGLQCAISDMAKIRLEQDEQIAALKDTVGNLMTKRMGDHNDG